MPARERQAQFAPGDEASGRERVEHAAYRLFSRRGVRGVGVDTVISEARVAKMTLYRNFASKDDLVLAFLMRREELWTRGWLCAESTRRGSTPRERLLAIFDIFDEWFRDPEFEGCAFVTTMLEFTERSSPVRQASVAHLAEVRGYVRGLAAEAGVADPDAFSRQWHLLMNGSIIAAAEGDADAAVRARDLALLLLRCHGI
ncbi:TetR/AcrR family transcriptional regulator [Pseudonocardia acaciae]|uniref:TetR/AcrR family transcriptional regulator n=1 Tax=Pseudonocardia acaciae TaxID=551276 RepID=UPI00048C56BA|nr:TetR/AcrR family transcriptional regulator [Pseudonocardia acaciae]